MSPRREENPESIATGRRIVDSAGSAVQLPYIPIPFDCSLVVKALSGNAGTIYVSESKVSAQDTNSAFPLAPGDAIELKVKNSSSVWIDASVSGEGINWIVERAVL